MNQDLEYLRSIAQSCADENPGDPEADMVICGCDLLQIIEERDSLLIATRAADATASAIKQHCYMPGVDYSHLHYIELREALADLYAKHPHLKAEIEKR